MKTGVALRERTLGTPPWWLCLFWLLLVVGQQEIVATILFLTILGFGAAVALTVYRVGELFKRDKVGRGPIPNPEWQAKEFEFNRLHIWPLFPRTLLPENCFSKFQFFGLQTSCFKSHFPPRGSINITGSPCDWGLGKYDLHHVRKCRCFEMCWAWDERAGSMWWDPSDVWAYFLSQNSSLLSVPVLSFSSWFSHFHLLFWSLNFLSSLNPNWHLCFHLPHSFDAWRRIANTWRVYTYSDLPEEAHSLHLSTYLKYSGLATYFDRFPQRQIRQQVY